MSLKIIGAGWARTGTMSLKTALETLGFAPCYHMIELLVNPKHLYLWNTLNGNYHQAFHSIFKNYTAALDHPTCQYWRELSQCYPAAKMILTIRDPEQWYDSVINTISRVNPGMFVRLKLFSQSLFSQHKRDLIRVFTWVEYIIMQNHFEGRIMDKKYVIDKYLQHIEEVKSALPSTRLLIYNIQSGWEPLCKFLDTKIPVNMPFPHLNKRNEFSQLIRQYM